MSLLTETPPETVTVGGEAIRIHTDFRAGVRFERMALAGGHTVDELLGVWFDKIPRDRAAAMEAALWFYRCGADETPLRPASRGTAAYDFEQDAGMLIASFSSAYGIDLASAKIHWWTFRALMLGLPDDCRFKQAVYYRTADLTGLSGEEKRRMERLRRRFALKTRREASLSERNGRWLGYVDRRFREQGGK